MKILKNIIVPTGNIVIVSGEKGNLECLSMRIFLSITKMIQLPHFFIVMMVIKAHSSSVFCFVRKLKT